MSTIKSSGKGSWSLLKSVAFPPQTDRRTTQPRDDYSTCRKKRRKRDLSKDSLSRLSRGDYTSFSCFSNGSARAALHVDVACQIARHPVGSLRTGALFSALPAYNNALGSLSLMDILITHPTPVSYSISPKTIFWEKTKNKFRPG
jgi:hypothetical protein